MYNKIFKSDQVSLGIPVQIRVPVNFQTIKMAYKPEAKEDSDELEKEAAEAEEDNSENYEDIIQKAKEEAEAIIEEAELEAQRILESAEIEAFNRKQSIEDESRQKGFETGYEEAKSMYEDLLSEAEFVKEHASVEYCEIMAGIEKDALELIMNIAEKVIGEEISLNKENIISIVGQALEKCSNREEIAVKVSVQDYDFLVDNKEKLLSMVDGIENLEIKRDHSLKPGDCLVETPYGSIDAGVQTKLRKIEEAFMKLKNEII